MKPSPSHRTTVLWTIGASGLIFGLLALFSCSQTESFEFVRIENDPRKTISQPIAKTDLAIIFTGSTRGEFEPCGCGGVYDGGFARRSTVIDRIRSVNPNLILLDTGDTTAGGSATQAEFILQAYHRIGYDAIALGEGDLRIGPEAFERHAKKYSIPYICSNVTFNEPTSVREVISINRGGLKIAIISVISERWLGVLPMEYWSLLNYETPADTLERLVPQLRQQHDVVILLSHLGSGERRLVEDHLDGVDLWIDNGGHQVTATSQPIAASQSTMIIQSPQEQTFFFDQSPPLFVSWHNDRKIGIAGLRWQNRNLTVAIAELLALSRDMLEDAAFLEIYDAYKFLSRQEMINRLTRPTRAGDDETIEFQYVPSSHCGDCHENEYRFWKTTPHARAFETLKKGDRDADLNCWSCHSTGFREPGGFQNPIATPKLVNVGCQDCHRKDLRSHPIPEEEEEDPSATLASLAKHPNPDDNLTESWQCQRCHVPHRSPKYEAESYHKAVNCSLAPKIEDNEADKE